MFDSLTEKLQSVFDELGRKGRLTEGDIDAAMRQIRLALLEADVHYGVVRDFTARVKERALGAEVMRSLSPAQQVVKIVYDELVAMLGQAAPLEIGRGAPPVILMAGLQGSGKTTTAAKLALALRKKGKRPLLVACDTRRPAAVDQLQALGRQLDIPVYSEGTAPNPADIAERSLGHALRGAHNVVLVDTSGRLQIDDELMAEIEEIARRVRPSETVLVVDSMTGQEAVNVAQAFHERLALTGLILTKVDGDARGGAALSVRAVTGVPIKFLGVGEKPVALEPFDPERMASRILGMGDVLSLIERAEAAMDQAEAARVEKRLRQGKMDLQDFLGQMQQIKRMGPLREILAMVPGLGSLKKDLPFDMAEQNMKRIEAIIQSMTPLERRRPDVLDASRKRRVAAGSGTTVQEINQLLRQFREMQRILQQVSQGRMPRGFTR
jgi:signal recognition particle subunit SRP54